jgi:hypothetical protein
MLTRQEFNEGVNTIILDRNGDRAEIIIITDTQDGAARQSIMLPVKEMKNLISILSSSPFIFSNNNK